MAARTDVRNAAERHYHDAILLLNNRRHDNAGYHFGLAAECTVKALMKQAGIPEQPYITSEGVSRRGAYYAHFPDLKAAISQEADGRINSRVLTMVEHPAFLQGWNTKMRYSPTQTVTRDIAEKWRENANALLAELNQ